MSSTTADNVSGGRTRSALAERALRAFGSDAHLRERFDGGMLNIDRALPFIFVYRRPASRHDVGTERLIVGEASYMIVDDHDDNARDTLIALAETATAELGSFLIVEIWAGKPDSRSFVVHAPDGPAPAVVDALRRGLSSLHTDPHATDVVVRNTDDRHPPGMQPLIATRTCWDIGCLVLGLEVPPIYRDESTGDVFPVYLRKLRSRLSRVLRQAVYEFTRVQTTATIASYQALGTRRLDRAAADADHELAEIERSYPMLLLLSAVNSREAWSRFRDSGFERAPRFRYRLLPVDPDALKRRLYDIDLEPIADPAMAFLLQDKRVELDRQITLIAERGSAGFRFASMRLYGVVDDTLLNVARDILDTVPSRRRRRMADVEMVSAQDFAAHARAELDYYRVAMPELSADVQVRPDLVGLMVSQGNLLIGEGLSLRPERVAPLLHHEVGTHVLTFFNGRAQPLHQLASGLADYDEMQEGIAVLTEYLAGGLDAARMRTLAGRVLAAHSVEQSASFMDTFRMLTGQYDFTPAGAFDITERVHQCGGFTRDLIYLRGLVRLVEYLRDGGDFEPLFVGKIAAKHIGIIEELTARGMLEAAPLRPRIFDFPDTHERLDAVRNGLALTGMISGTE